MQPHPEHPDTSTPASAARWREPAAIALVLAVFAAVLALVSLEQRVRWRTQVLAREGEVLRAVLAMQQAVDAGHSEYLDTPDDRILASALDTSNLRGVIAVRVFDAGGTFRDAVPAQTDDSALTPADLAELENAQPLVRFHGDLSLDAILLGDVSAARARLLEVIVPVEETVTGSPVPAATARAGFVQYWISGHIVAAEFARLDRHLALQTGIAFTAGALLIGGSLLWAFRRLAKANDQLRKHADDLARANREFAQAARTAALGAITAHLMHSMRNPLAGIEGLVAAQADAEHTGPDGEWAHAREATRRIRSLIDEVHALLGDLAHGAEFEVTPAELCAGLRERLGPAATLAGVRLKIQTAGAHAPLGAREAGIGGLVLANLVQNAIEASAAGSCVEITASESIPGLCELWVSDSAGGLSAEVAADPFRPRVSTKPDGAGIGLAISGELARHAGGSVEIVRTGSTGTVFRLRLPTAARQSSRPSS